MRATRTLPLPATGPTSAFVKCRFAMQFMQFAHIRRLDLSLLEPLYALLDERHVTRAAHRCDMSQSAMSRALDRLRSALDDELLVRSRGAYERTPRGDQLLGDLQALLPGLDAAVRGNRFDPATSNDRFCIATTDYAASILVPAVLERVATAAPSVRIEVVAWNDRVFDDIEGGRIHLAVIGVRPPEPFESEPLFSDEFVCVVAENHPLLGSRVTLKRYVEYEHAVVAIGKNGGQPWIERALAARGLERRVAYRSPFQLSAMLAASQSTMICTTARRLATQLAPVANVRLLSAPRELPKIAYRMAWHRRLRDDAAQSWLRHQLSAIAKQLFA
jgi:DNA-binding transcriptional LysR family regulator